MISTTKAKKNDTTSKSPVLETTVPDSIVPPVPAAQLSLADEFKEIKDLVTKFTERLDSLEAKLNLQQPPDLSLSVNVEKLATRLSTCESNYDTVVQKFYNYKKDVHDYLGMGTPSYMNSSNVPSPSHDHDVPMSFRMVLEKIGNPLDPLTNHHFQTFLTQYNKWQHYRDRGGYLSLYGYVQTSPAVYDLYLRKAKSQDPSFTFTITDNSLFFSELLDHVFFPNGFDIAAFDMLIKDKRMKSFSILSAGQYAFDVNLILLSLQSQLKTINSSDLWNVVSMHVSPPQFQKFLQKRLPPSQKQFLTYIDQSAKLFDQRVTMDFDIRRDTNQLAQQTRPPDFSPSQQFPKSYIDNSHTQPSFHRKANHVGIIDVCPYCNSPDCDDNITCSQYQLFQQFRNSDYADKSRLESQPDSSTPPHKAFSLRRRLQLHENDTDADIHNFLIDECT